MKFHSPHLLWLLAPLALLLIWELVRHTARAATSWPKIARAWAGAFDVSLGAKHTTADSRPRLWLWLGLMLCVVALARPQWGVLEEKTLDQSREVIIALDLSRSMMAQDVKPSRLDRSKLLIQSLLDNLKGERVGLVLFAGTAFLQSPLSADYEVLREFLPALNPDYLPEGGSNYKAMLEATMQAYGTSTADRYLIILSDGESTADDWKDLTGALKTKDVRIIGLGVGTAQGSFIPDASGGLVKDERGAVVMSRLNSSTLQDLAQMTGGAYTDASAWVDLAGLLSKTVDAGKKGDFSEKSTARLAERFQWFLAPGLLLLIISFWAEFPVRPRERALPLAGGRRVQKTEDGEQAAPPVIAAIAIILFSVFCTPSFVQAAEDAASPGDTLAAPLSKTIARLAEKADLTAKEYAEMAETTVTYGQRVKSAKQQPPETVIRDALQAVDAGEKVDAKAADWPKIRHDLEELLKREEQKKDDKKDDQKKQDQQQQQQQQNQDQQNQDQKQDQQNQDKSQQDQQKNEQQKQDEQQQQEQKERQSAFGDMKEPQDKKPPQPKPGTQKVGGQQDKQPTEQVEPELAMPLQKLEQVRNQDSPAKLQQLMQGPQKKTKGAGKDW